MDQDKARQRRWLTLGVLCFSLLVITVDGSIINVALPTFVRELGATNSELQWIVDAYTLVFAGLLLTAGSLGDRLGRKWILLAGLGVFLVGSVAGAMATTPTQVIATRALMGVGGAMIMPSTLSIITNVFTDPRERGRAIALWAAVAGVGIALGPISGGWLLEHFWWGSIFLVNVPVLALATVGVLAVVPNSKDPTHRRLDPVGAVLSIVGLTVLLWGIIEAPVRGWTDTTVVGALVGGLALLGAFVVWERRFPSPMLDMSFFRNPRFSAASIAITLVFFAMFGSLFLMTQYLQFVQGYSALEAGVRILPYAMTMMVAAPLSARIVERVGTKAVVTAGMTILSIGLASLALLQVDSTYGQLAVSMVIMATGMGLTMAPSTESIMGSLPRAKAGVGSAVNDTTRQVGGALGVAVIGSVMASGYGSRMADALASSGVPVPPQVADAVEQSLGAALAVAERAGGAAGELLATTAQDAFVTASHAGVLLGAVVALGGALVALVWLPARAARVAAPDAPERAAQAVPPEGPPAPDAHGLTPEAATSPVVP